MRYVDKVGLEIETAINTTDYDWDDSPNGIYSKLVKKVPHCLEAKDDGSIHTTGNHKAYAIEVVSKPLKNSGQILAFMNGLSKYIDIEEVNKSMGFHIHLSFKKHSYYVLLFSKEFADLFRKTAVEKFPDLAERLTSRYCAESKKDYFLDRFRYENTSHDDRYKAVNVACSYYERKTIEFRFFRSVEVPKMLEYTKWLIGFVQDYIQKHTIDIEMKTPPASQDRQKINIKEEIDMSKVVVNV